MCIVLFCCTFNRKEILMERKIFEDIELLDGEEITEETLKELLNNREDDE